ncbi:hypothetical protein CTEN210_00389 [Chaetoceros tenuissimus]|uniref:Uncharacterized protein n=1 Tax=Chaetoceros tenuissimus TaxID=426638 RepID=A0AAD3CF30_9STRA|nr:hypothetical protein CTEN210_00389 [Chaetoceros tenuissimus]
MSYWNGTEWVSNSMDQNSSNPIPPPSTELPQIPENLKGTINVNNATAEQLTNFYSKVYAYCDSQMNACKSSGDTSSTSYEWSVYYADLSSRAAHHYNNLKNETEDERQRKLAEEERKRSREQARIQREREERERQERVVSEMCRKAAEACKESFEAEKAKEEAAKKEKLKRASLLEEALINKITEEANDIADIEKVMQRRKRSLKESLELLPENLRPKISFENEVSSNTNNCVICQQQDAIMAIVPCGHM